MKAPSNSELTTETHVFFLRGVFSNFTATPDLLFDGNLFQTTEQAFMYANNKHILDESKWKGQNLLGEVLMKVRQTLRLRTDVDFESTLYAKACELIQVTPDKLSFDQIVKGLNLSANEVDPQAINLALGWASQAHVKYLEDN